MIVESVNVIYEEYHISTFSGKVALVFWSIFLFVTIALGIFF
jgi:hypothetical protein